MSAAPGRAAAPPPVDLVTALQEALSRLNAMLFNYLGALQRDAPPQPLKADAEVLVAPPKTFDVQAQTEVMAADMLAGLQDIERLIQQLPAVTASEGEEVAAAAALLQRNAEAAGQLQQELDAAAAKLARLQDAHGALAAAALACRAAAADSQAAGRAADAAG